MCCGGFGLHHFDHLMGCGVGELPQREVIGQTLQCSQPEVLAFCEELIQRMEAETQVQFSQDANLFYSLLLHINSMITRIQYNVRIVCLLKEKTIAEFPQRVPGAPNQPLSQKMHRKRADNILACL